MFEIAIVLFTFLVYFRTFNFGLIVDDVRHVKDIEAPNSIFKDVSIFENIKRRLYGAGTLAIPSQKVNIRNEHILSTALHALIGVLIYKAFGSNLTSLSAALLYCVNPANNQTAIWLNGRRYAINIIAVLLMVITPYAFVLYPLTAFLQVNAIFAPVLLGGWCLLAIPVYLVLGKTIDRFRERVSNSPADLKRLDFSLNRLIPITKCFGFYFFKMLVPGKTLMYYPTLYFWGMTKEGNKDAYALNKDFIKGVLALSLALLGLIMFPGKEKLYCLFMILSIVQFSNVTTVTQTLADRYMSLPNVFMMYFVASLLNPFICVMIAVYYATRLQTTFEMYKDILSFYDYHLYHDPKGLSARTFKMIECIKSQDNFAAWELVRNGLYHHPKDFKMLYSGALCLAKINPVGNKEQIESFLKEAEENVYLGQEAKNLEMVNRLREEVYSKAEETKCPA